MPRITTINSGAFSISSSILSLERENLQEYYEVNSDVSVIDEGDSVVFSFQYRNINTTKTIYWEIIPSENITFEDFSTLMNGTFQIVNSGVENVTITAAKDFTNINEEITENFTIRFRETDENGNIIITSSEVDILDTSYLAVGQQSFTTPGIYTFTVPERVNKISFVLIGGGGAQSSSTTSSNGANGGSLTYVNNLSVQEGQEIVLLVGAGGTIGSTPTSGQTTILYINEDGSPFNLGEDQPGVYYFLPEEEGLARASATGGRRGGLAIQNNSTSAMDSFIINNSSVTVRREGGKGGIRGFRSGGTVLLNGGGGSTGGYSADGVSGGNGGDAGQTGQGGSGGGGAGVYDGTGGGTGIWGQGTSGLPGYYVTGYSYVTFAGKAGSKLGSTEVYRQFGGAGGSTVNSGNGAVRIIWPGQLRQYPSTRTADETPIP